MAVKTITIDVDAYEILAGQKRDRESFSQVIKRRLRPAATGARLLANLNQVRLADDTLDKLEQVVGTRRPASRPSVPLDIET